LSNIVEKDTNLLDLNFIHVIRLIGRFVVIIVGTLYLVRAVSGKPLSALLAIAAGLAWLFNSVALTLRLTTSLRVKIRILHRAHRKRHIFTAYLRLNQHEAINQLS